MTIFNLIFYLTIVKFICSKIVLNIDNNSINLNYSDYLKYSPFNTSKYNNKANKTSLLMKKLGEIENDESIQINLEHEYNGIVINDLMIIENHNILKPGYDFIIESSIKENIFPQNYFESSKFNRLSSNLSLECIYTNPGSPSSYGYFPNLTYSKIESLINYNIALDKDPGVHLIKMENFSLYHMQLDEFIKKNNPSNSNNYYTNKTIYNDMFLSIPFFETNNYLTLVEKGNEITIFNITDSYDNPGEFNIIPFTSLNLSEFGILNITKISVYDKYILISDYEGLKMFTKTDSAYKFSVVNVTGKDEKIKINDFIINNNTVYIIVNNVGMYIYNLDKANMTSFYFKHPSLKKFDYSFDFETYLYFVGISVDNDPPQITELFIELIILLGSEESPMINRVFVSDKKYNYEYIVTDLFYGLSYLYDKDNYNLLVFTRSIPNIYDVFHYRYNIKSYVQNNFKVEANDNPLYLLGEYGNYKSAVMIKNDDEFIIFAHFEFPKNSLKCDFYRPGKFSFSFVTSKNCDNLGIIGEDAFNKCTFQVFYTVIVEGNQKIVLWIILSIILIIVVSVVIVVIIIKLRRCKKKTNENYIQHNNLREKDNEVIEVNVDN